MVFLSLHIRHFYQHRPLSCAFLLLSCLLTNARAATITPTYTDVPFAQVPSDAGTTLTLRMNIYMPKTVTSSMPIVLYVHGGGWRSGDHTSTPYAPLATLLDYGIAVVTTDYRLSQQAIFPAQIHDVKGAIRFLRAKAAAYGFNANRIGCWGSSAGGHLAALLATSGGVSELEGTTGGNLQYSSRIRVAVDYFGPTDLLNAAFDVTTPPGSTINYDAPDSPSALLIGFGGAGQGVGVLRQNQSNPAAPFPQKMALITEANPITHITPDDPPIFIGHGQQDTTVPYKQSRRLNQALLTAGNTVVHQEDPTSGHGDLSATVDAAALEFLIQHLTSNSATNWGEYR